MQNTKAYIMLICATLFWAGNFVIGKLAFLTNIPPMSLVFLRWFLVWIILLPFTFQEIVRSKEIILKNIKNNETLIKFSKIISNRGLSL